MENVYFYKVSNLVKFGEYNYKGLDIDQFITGSQIYDDKNNSFAVVSTEDFSGSNVDVKRLTEQEYLLLIPAPVNTVSVESRLEEMETVIFNAILEGKL